MDKSCYKLEFSTRMFKEGNLFIPLSILKLLIQIALKKTQMVCGLAGITKLSDLPKIGLFLGLWLVYLATLLIMAGVRRYLYQKLLCAFFPRHQMDCF